MDVSAAFEWDNSKAESNLAKHGLPFEEALAVFADALLVTVGTGRAEDGEERQEVIGTIAGRRFTVVFVMRGDTCRLISARRSNASEERSYGQREA